MTSVRVPSEDPAWSRMCDTLAQSLKSLDKQTSGIRRATEKIHTMTDVPKAKERMNQLIDSSRSDVAQIQETMSLVHKYIKLHPDQKPTAQRLNADAQSSIEDYQRAHHNFLTRMQAVERKAAAKGSVLPDDEDEPEDADEDDLLVKKGRKGGSRAGKPPVKGKKGGRNSAQAFQRCDSKGGRSEEGDAGADPHSSTQQQQVMENFDQQLHDELMHERRKEVEEIAENLADIRDIFRHIDLLVGEQGEKLDQMETNIDHANDKIEGGVSELDKARRLAGKNRARNCVFLGILLVSLAIILAIAVR